jgi:outer membrane lipoprotein SlyB
MDALSRRDILNGATIGAGGLAAAALIPARARAQSESVQRGAAPPNSGAGLPDDINTGKLIRKLAIPPALPTALCVLVGLSACAGADYRPVVDMRGHNETAYQRDLAACQQQARGVRNNTDIAEDAGAGALGGAALGAVGGAIGGAPGLGAGIGALAGLVGGSGFKEAQTENREQQIVKNCIRARGYHVLG